MSLPWKHRRELPQSPEPMAILVAYLNGPAIDETNEPMIVGLYTVRNGIAQGEWDGCPPLLDDWHWVAEDEVLAGIGEDCTMTAEYLIAHIGHTTKHNEHITWWRPDSRGYTICIDKAGRYAADKAEEICRYGGCIAISTHYVEPMARTTPYYRLTNGTIGKMYDGGPHRPVPNIRSFWNLLMRARAYPPQEARVEKPTPIGANARAIYIDGVQMGEEARV